MLAGERYDRVWSSDLQRAVESARLAAESGGSWPPAVADARLRELNFGDFEGRGYDEIGGQFGDVVAHFRDFEVPGGESWQGFRDRLVAFVDELEDGRHLLFVHGGVIRVLTQDLGLDRFVTTGSVVVIAPRDGRLVDIREAEE
jgi:probable phosphoglycerate mutase